MTLKHEKYTHIIDQLTLLLRANVEVNYNLRPFLVYHSANIRPLKGNTKDLFSVYLYSNAQGWIKSKVSCNYFSLKLE
jgi:hypothetical protein